MATRRQQIAAWNDELRRRIYFPPEGDLVLIPESLKKGPDAVLQAIRDFDTFSRSDDPDGTHRRGRVVVGNHTYTFEIAYWNPDLSQSQAPLDEATRRFLMIEQIS